MCFTSMCQSPRPAEPPIKAVELQKVSKSVGGVLQPTPSVDEGLSNPIKAVAPPIWLLGNCGLTGPYRLPADPAGLHNPRMGAGVSKDLPVVRTRLWAQIVTCLSGP